MMEPCARRCIGHSANIFIIQFFNNVYSSLCVSNTNPLPCIVLVLEEYESLPTGNPIFQVIATSEKADQLIVTGMSNAPK